MTARNLDQVRVLATIVAMIGLAAAIGIAPTLCASL
jgi:hypothetical protein